MTRIFVDARMVKSSGIGTIIANVVPRLMHRCPQWDFHLLGDWAVLATFEWSRNAKVSEFTAPIYSLAEQRNFPASVARSTDILWSPNYNIPLRWPGRLLVNVNDMAHLVLPEFRRSLAKQVFARLMFGAVRRRADAIAFISHFSADEFHRLVGRPRGHEAVIHCGVDEAWFEAGPGPMPAAPYLVYVGNVKPHKNLTRLLDAFALVKNDLPHDLLILGRKEGFITGDNDVLARIEAFGGRVAFTGYVSDSAVKQTVAGADGLILPSLYEGFGLPPVEAMAAGCPVLVSTAASLPEICQNAALYCNPLDVADIAAQMRRLVSDQALRQTLRDRGRARARALNWQACAEGYESVIAAL